MKLAEYGKLNALRFLYSVNSIQATLERKLSDIIKSAFLKGQRCCLKPSLAGEGWVRSINHAFIIPPHPTLLPLEKELILKSTTLVCGRGFSRDFIQVAAKAPPTIHYNPLT